MLTSRTNRRSLAADDPAGAPGAVARAGVDPNLEDRALRDALRSAIATRRGSCSWDVDLAGCKWVVTLHSPEEQTFSGTTLEEELARCLVWLMASEPGAGPFVRCGRRIHSGSPWLVTVSHRRGSLPTL